MTDSFSKIAWLFDQDSKLNFTLPTFFFVMMMLKRYLVVFGQLKNKFNSFHFSFGTCGGTDRLTYRLHCVICIKQVTCAINDPLGHTHIHASSDHYSSLNFFLYCEVLKSGDWRTDNTCENRDHYRPWLWVGLVDQYLLYMDIFCQNIKPDHWAMDLSAYMSFQCHFIRCFKAFTMTQE